MTEDEKQWRKRRPTLEQSSVFQQAYDYFNATLFEGELPPVMLSMSRNAQIVGGHYCADRWYDEDGSVVSEIAINVNVLKKTGAVKSLVILLHEMVHHWQYHFGKPSRGGYHNSEWADKCKKIGLKPFSADGKETGQAVDTALLDGMEAEQAIIDMPSEYMFPWLSEPSEDTPPGGGGQGGGGRGVVEGDHGCEPKKQGVKTKYHCPVCGFNLWGKSGGNFLCCDCDQALVEMKGGE